MSPAKANPSRIVSYFWKWKAAGATWYNHSLGYIPAGLEYSHSEVHVPSALPEVAKSRPDSNDMFLVFSMALLRASFHHQCLQFRQPANLAQPYQALSCIDFHLPGSVSPMLARHSGSSLVKTTTTTAPKLLESCTDIWCLGMQETRRLMRSGINVPWITGAQRICPQSPLPPHPGRLPQSRSSLRRWLSTTAAGQSRSRRRNQQPQQTAPVNSMHQIRCLSCRGLKTSTISQIVCFDTDTLGSGCARGSSLRLKAMISHPPPPSSQKSHVKAAFTEGPVEEHTRLPVSNMTCVPVADLLL